MLELRIKETSETDPKYMEMGSLLLGKLEFWCPCGYRISEEYHQMRCRNCNRLYKRNFDKVTREWVITLDGEEDIPSFPRV